MALQLTGCLFDQFSTLSYTRPEYQCRVGDWLGAVLLLSDFVLLLSDFELLLFAVQCTAAAASSSGVYAFVRSGLYVH